MVFTAMALAGLGNNREIGMNRMEYHDGFEASPPDTRHSCKLRFE
jgi:hypothetical protein